MGASRGEDLIDGLKAHVLETMRRMPDCAAGGPGRPNKDVEKAAGLALDLPRQDGWLTWSVLMRLALDGQVEFVRKGKRGDRYFRLK
jgi:hypothetical protein